MHLITGSQESNTWERVVRHYYWFRRRLAKLQRRMRHLIAFGNAIFLLQLTWEIHIPTYPCVICSLSFLQRVLQRCGGIKYWTVICEDNQWLYWKFYELQIPLPNWQGKVSEDNKITGSWTRREQLLNTGCPGKVLEVNGNVPRRFIFVQGTVNFPARARALSASGSSQW